MCKKISYSAGMLILALLVALILTGYVWYYYSTIKDITRPLSGALQTYQVGEDASVLSDALAQAEVELRKGLLTLATSAAGVLTVIVILLKGIDLILQRWKESKAAEKRLALLNRIRREGPTTPPEKYSPVEEDWPYLYDLIRDKLVTILPIAKDTYNDTLRARNQGSSAAADTYWGAKIP